MTQDHIVYCTSADCQSKECDIRAWNHKFYPGEIIKVADLSGKCKSYIGQTAEENESETY